jgi:hypothetical protein
MSDDDRHALVQALITEAVSLLAMAIVLYALAHKTDLEHWWWRHQRRQGARARAEARALREVRAEISRLEHGEG